MRKVYEKPRVTQVELLSGEAVMDPGCKRNAYAGPGYPSHGLGADPNAYICGWALGTPCNAFSAGS